jgi:RimJ/RimL family protein N-acetyltransferase
MNVLDSTQYLALWPLFAKLQQNLVVESVLNGFTRGRVYVNDTVNPCLGVLWTEMDAVLLAGEPNEQFFPLLRHLILNEMIPDAHSRYIPHFTITVDRPAWVQKLPQLLPNNMLVPVSRLAFRLEPPSLDWRALLPADMTLQPINAFLFNQLNLENIAAVEGWARSFWLDIATFVQGGLGFAVLDGTTIASWALSVYAGEGAVELGVETAASHRGRGLATVAAAACLEACARRNWVPHWQCDETNVPSMRLAARLGFVVQRRYTDFRLSFPSPPTFTG